MVSSERQPQVSEATIRRFLLAELSGNQQSSFEATLLSNSPFAQRVRLAEIELIDDYAAGRINARERAAFQQKFLVTTGRERTLEVSTALQTSLRVAPAERGSWSASSAFARPRLAVQIAFAVVLLVVLFTGVWVVRKKPQFVWQVVPKRVRPAALPTPTPQAAHHAAGSAESRNHQDEAPTLPGHEFSSPTFVLPDSTTAKNPSVVSLPRNGAQFVRLQLLLLRKESATYGVAVTTVEGELIYSAAEIPVENADQVELNVPVDRLKPGDFKVTLTQLKGETSTPTIYYVRIQ